MLFKGIITLIIKTLKRTQTTRVKLEEKIEVIRVNPEEMSHTIEQATRITRKEGLNSQVNTLTHIPMIILSNS